MAIEQTQESRDWIELMITRTCEIAGFLTLELWIVGFFRTVNRVKYKGVGTFNNVEGESFYVEIFECTRFHWLNDGAWNHGCFLWCFYEYR